MVDSEDSVNSSSLKDASSITLDDNSGTPLLLLLLLLLLPPNWSPDVHFSVIIFTEGDYEVDLVTEGNIPRLKMSTCGEGIITQLEWMITT